MTFHEALQAVSDRKSLSRAQAREAMTDWMTGDQSPVLLAAYLVALRVKGESAEELAGSAEAMREESLVVRPSAALIVDSCGTGGDGKGSFNVSTAVAFVVAGAGLTVAKHGNRAVSSQCGSADLLQALGLAIDSGPAVVERTLREVGLAFLFAPRFHPALKAAMPVRRELRMRTLFNLLGPLINPARPHVQLLGVYDSQWVKPVAQALVELGAQEGVVVHGQGADEIVLSGTTEVAEIRGGTVYSETWSPEDFGLKTQLGRHADGGAPEQNAKIFHELLDGKPGVYREIVGMNSAALIRAAYRTRAMGGKELSLKDAYLLAMQSIDSKAALSKLQALKQSLTVAVS